MKKIRLIFSLSALLVLASSCKDFIEVTPRGQQNLDTYFQTATECQTFLNGEYRRIWMLWDWGALVCPYVTNQMATDDAWMGNTEQDQSDHIAVALYTLSPSSMGRTNNIYRHRFENISNCNYAIAGIENSPIDESLKPYLIAQAKFMRAFNYYELVCNFGGVPLIDAPIGTTEMDKQRASAEDTWAFIIQDLLDAEAASPVMAPQVASGRVSKGACQALLARAYLFSGNWQKAYDYATTVINSGTYTLEPNFVNIWDCGNHNGVESIFEIQTAPNTDRTLGNFFVTMSGARAQHAENFPSGSASDVADGWGWCMPTSDLENAYRSENDEIRRLSTIMRNGEPVYGDEVLNPTYIFAWNKSHRAIRKFYRPIEWRRYFYQNASADARTPLNHVVLRLGEMYLTRAEAAFHLNNATQALADINVLRARVNLPEKTGLSGNDLLYAIYKERRLELAFEGMRLYDIRRQIDPATGKPMIASILGPNGSFVKYNTGPDADPWEVSETKEPQDKGINFDINKHLLWPIPDDEINRSGIAQNPGY